MQVKKTGENLWTDLMMELDVHLNVNLVHMKYLYSGLFGIFDERQV